MLIVCLHQQAEYFAKDQQSFRCIHSLPHSL